MNKSSNINSYIRSSRAQEVIENIQSLMDDLNSEGLNVEFGKIGNRTNYAMIFDDSHTIEVVGYTYIKNMRYYDENVGKLKALQQAIARRELSER